MKSVKGKRVLVTGAAMGMGRLFAERAIAEGAAAVVLWDLNESALNDTLTELAGGTAEVSGWIVDVADPASVADTAAAVLADLGGIDILINNAGITRDTLLIRMSEEDWDAVLDINLKGAFLVTKAVAKVMIKQRAGAIVNIASVVGLMGNAGQANYTASKAGLMALTKTAAKELGGRNIRVNAVAPGFIRTAMTEQLPGPAKEAMLRLVPLGRPGEPEEVAKAVAFLASDNAAYVNGQTLAVCGGMVW